MAGSIPKDTSFHYGEEYQRIQVDKFRQRHQSHWQHRIKLAHDLLDAWAIPRFNNLEPREVSVLDVGCSIGTFAIEMALRGFVTYGIDFDAAAIAIAKNLCIEEGVSVEFFQGDVAEWGGSKGSNVDIALCFDIFEHLHDDELGSMLQSIRRQLSDNGVLIFHTFPLQYDYLFYSREILSWPLLPFRCLSPRRFERIVRLYAALIDVGLLLTTSRTYKERIEKQPHCNPLTRDRLKGILERSGYEVALIETNNIYPFQEKIIQRFSGQYAAHRNMYGVAYPRSRNAQ